MESRYMLDTNTSSYVIKGIFPSIRKKLMIVPMAEICISAITQAELLFGLVKKPQATQLKTAVQEFLLRVEILPWTSQAAELYAHLRGQLELKGKSLGQMDLLIAAHAQAVNAILVTNDQPLLNLKPLLKVADWSKP